MICRNVLSSLIPILLMFTGLCLAQADFTRIIIDTSFAENSLLSDLKIADLNGDSELDLVVAVNDYFGDGDALFWYRNDGDEYFMKIIVDTAVDLPEQIALGDTDDDFDSDIVLGTSNDGLFLFSNNGAGIFTKSLIDRWLTLFRKLHLIDMDNDGDNDILSLSTWGVFLEVNEGNNNFVRDTIEAVPIVDVGLHPVDLDGNLYTDIVTSIYDDANSDHILVWYKNQGNTVFTRETIDVLKNTYMDIVVDDLDSDGDKDIITGTFEDNTILWYSNDGNENFTRDTIGVDFNQAPRSIAVTDIDNDNDRDVVVTGGNSKIGEVACYENDGSNNFTKRTIDDRPGNRRRIQAIDIDHDNDTDIFAINTYPLELVLYRNDRTTGVQADWNPKEQNKFILEQNYPNPFKAQTVIGYRLPVESDVRLSIYNVAGKVIATIVSERQDAGNYVYAWDAGYLPGGTYSYRLRTGEAVETRKFLLLR